MSSFIHLRLARGIKWIVSGAMLWSVLLFFVARTTYEFRRHQRHAFDAQLEVATGDLQDDLDRVGQENSRLRQELKQVSELRDTATRLHKELAAKDSAQLALWNAHSNLLEASIEETRRELGEISRWDSEWHKTKTREAAQARLAEKENSGDPLDYAQTKEILSSIAHARKRLSDIRREWRQLDKSEKEKFRPQLQAAQDAWWAAQQALGKDSVLYEDFPLRPQTNDPAASLLMRSILPDQNGQIVSVFLDGTVTFSKAAIGAEQPASGQPR